MGRKHNVDEVLKDLSRKHDLSINKANNTIFVLSDKIHDKDGVIIDNPLKLHDIGNKSWGKIDFLVNYHDYHVVKVAKF